MFVSSCCPPWCSLSESLRRKAARRILDRVAEAYGRMMLLDGLFQADGHPGNILVMKGGAGSEPPKMVAPVRHSTSDLT